jgi:hypothetical protein
VTVAKDIRAPNKLMMKKNVAAIRRAGRTAGLISASIKGLVLFVILLVSQASKARHFQKSEIS